MLEQDALNVKALYRRAQAYLDSQDYVEAEQVITGRQSMHAWQLELLALWGWRFRTRLLCVLIMTGCMLLHMQDIKSLLSADSTSRDARQLLMRYRKESAAFNQRQRSMFKNLFKPRSEPHSSKPSEVGYQLEITDVDQLPHSAVDSNDIGSAQRTQLLLVS